MSDWGLYTSVVQCECGASYDFYVQHPPIPMIVVGFYDEGHERGDCHCGRELVVPTDSPHSVTHRTATEAAIARGCVCKTEVVNACA